MKKILSVLLATLMLFTAVCMTASAAPITDKEINDYTADYNGVNGFIVRYNLNGFTAKDTVYDIATGKQVFMDNLTGVYYDIPSYEGEFTIGDTIKFPEIVAPEGKVFDGWMSNTKAVNNTHGRTQVTIDAEMAAGAIENHNVIEFKLMWSPAEGEGDTMGTIMGILTKVFGAILGLLFFNGRTEAGVQLMEQMLGGILG